jgi:hypothetical protein
MSLTIKLIGLEIARTNPQAHKTLRQIPAIPIEIINVLVTPKYDPTIIITMAAIGTATPITSLVVNFRLFNMQYPFAGDG